MSTPTRLPTPALRVGLVEADAASRETLVAMIAAQPALAPILVATTRGDLIRLRP